MSNSLPHISVCICTFKRPELLSRTLKTVCAQQTHNRFTYSVVVADNDKEQSARIAVEQAAQGASIEVKYCFEPRQGIAMARNCAVANAKGAFIAFIDDDEFAPEDWLLNLLQALEKYP